MDSYSSLFKPLNVGSTTLKNRYIMCGMGGMHLYKHDGSPAKDVYEYLVRRAQGGVGMIITRAIIVKPIGLDFNLWDRKEMFDPLKSLTDEVHKYDCKILMQLSAGAGRTSHFNLDYFLKKNISHENAYISPSDGVPNYWNPEILHRGLTTEEIYSMIDAFVEMAKIAKDTGFDGVELHGIHEGYLMDQFSMECTNQRTDEFGGSLEKRMGFPVEIIKRIKAECGEDFLISMRFSVESKMKAFNTGALPNEEYDEFGRNIEESIVAAKLFENAGCDLINADNGSYDAWYWAHPPVYMPEACNVEDVKKIKTSVNIPVFVAGRMDNPTIASEAITKDYVDGIGIARALLADPDYVNKVKDREFDEIRPCLACHSGCLAPIFKGEKLSCAVNPSVLCESKFEIKSKVSSIKKVAIIGAGLSGMECARLLKLHQQEVVLFEKENFLGGTFVSASSFDFKQKDKDLIEWYKKQLKKLNVDIRLNTQINYDTFNYDDFDEVIISTGAEQKAININGMNNDDIVSAIEYLKNGNVAGTEIIVIGGGLSGCEIAYDLAVKGKHVYIIEIENEILIEDNLCAALTISANSFCVVSSLFSIY